VGKGTFEGSDYSFRRNKILISFQFSKLVLLT